MSLVYVVSTTFYQLTYLLSKGFWPHPHLQTLKLNDFKTAQAMIIKLSDSS